MRGMYLDKNSEGKRRGPSDGREGGRERQSKEKEVKGQEGDQKRGPSGLVRRGCIKGRVLD